MDSIIELRKKELPALRKELRHCELELTKIKILVSIWKEKAIHKLHSARKYVARILTIINEKLNNKS